MRIVDGIGSAECLMETIRSQWVRPFGDTRFCEHPAAKQFVSLVNSMNIEASVELRDTLMAA